MNSHIVSFIKKGVFHLLMWTIIWVFFNFFFSSGSTNTSFVFWFGFLLSIVTIVSIYVFVYHLIPNFLLFRRYKFFILYSLYALVFIVFSVLIIIVFGFTFYFNLEYQNMPNLTKNPNVIIVCVLLMVTLASALKIVRANFVALKEKKNLENKILETQLKLKEEELKFLRMQIHPHFLFNTLNTLYGHAIKNSSETPNMILKLSNLLDYILYQINKETVLLNDEILHIKDYISLEEYRFSDTLNVCMEEEGLDANVKIAPMLLLPFVENAFKHGSIINNLLEINMKLKVQHRYLEFKISNSYIQKEGNQKGLGLNNIRKRLNLLYPEKHNLQIKKTTSRFSIDLKIDLKDA